MHISGRGLKACLKKAGNQLPMNTNIPSNCVGPWSIVKIETDGGDDVPRGLGLEDAPPGMYTALIHESRGFISCDSPVAMNDQEPVLDRPEGHVVVGGLGVGAVVDQLLMYEDVEHITIVEVDQDVIDLVAPAFELEDYADRLTFFRYDIMALDAEDFSTKPDRVWIDIWDSDHPQTLEDRLQAITEWGSSCSWVKVAALDRVFENARRAMGGG